MPFNQLKSPFKNHQQYELIRINGFGKIIRPVMNPLLSVVYGGGRNASQFNNVSAAPRLGKHQLINVT